MPKKIDSDFQEALSKINIFFDAYSANLPPTTQTKYVLIKKDAVPFSKLLSIHNLIKNFENIVRLKISSNFLKLPFYADSILFKSNIRINKIEGNDISIKIHDNTQNENFQNELEARKYVDQLSGKKVTPSLIEWDNQNASWYIEEHLDFSISRYVPVERFVTDVMQEIYQQTLYYDFLPNDYLTRIEQKNIPVLSDALSLAKSGKYKGTYGYCHGDLSKSNFAMDREANLLISDWEHAGNQPIAFDLAKLFVKHKETRSHVLNVMDTLCEGSKDCLSSRHQLAIAIAKLVVPQERQRLGGLRRKQRRLSSLAQIAIKELME